MPYLVDGDNLLGTWPGRARDDTERQRLAHELGRFAARLNKRVVVVFDGRGAAAAGPDLLFAGAGRRADDVILDFLRAQADRRGWIVITSDRSLGDRCRHLEAQVDRCDRFRKRLAEPAGPEKPDREPDVDYWLERFEG